MRILQLHNRHATRGGADDVLEQDCEMLRGAGHVVEQYVLPPAGADAGRAHLAVRAVWNRNAVAAVERLVRSWEPDVVHVHTPFPSLSPAVFHAAYRLGCPTVGTVHSYRYSCIKGTLLRDGKICEDCIGHTLKLPGLRHRCYHGTFGASAALTASLTLHNSLGTFNRAVSRFVTLTEFARGLMIRDGIAPGKITVKPNAVPDPGVPTDRARHPHTAVYMGRLVEEKGVRTLVEAFARLKGISNLTIAGDGPLRPLIERAAREVAGVRYVGWVEESKISALVASATLVVVPSEWYEAGPPLVLLRALAAGTPVVCSDLDNICSTVRECEAGATFRSGDSTSLAETIERVMVNPEWLAKAGCRARELYLRDHTPEQALQRLEAIYASVGVA
jgi:glycosyltransferase involved in cell wall biosynthesis